MMARNRSSTSHLARSKKTLALMALAVSAQAGCGREFFREWTNQDVSEAVFEKSRDPRWRLDLFSVEPPALARFSDPYDPDRPPAPPDDRAAEALSPVPQWPDNRLLVPAEGTGYLDMLDAWRRDMPAPAAPISPAPALRLENPGNTVPPSPPSDGSTSPFTIPPIPGASSPTPAQNRAPSEGSRSETKTSDSRPVRRDAGVTLAAFRQTGLPMPAPRPGSPASSPTETPRDLPTPPIGMDPEPSNRDLSEPINPRPDLPPDQYRASEALASDLAANLVPRAIDFNDAEAAGLPRQSAPYVVTMDQAFTLALINARIYQFQLEQVYLASLAVTQQRFVFTPQLYAGLSPLTGVAQGGGPGPGGGFAGPLFANSYQYATKATGMPVSTLNLGTVAGFGKVFSTGTRILGGFANQVVFNFIGHNSRQPRVQSFLPLTIVQPFLRGGGRAVTLELLTQAERNLLYAIRAFVKFRQEFTVATLIGGQIQNFGSAVASLGFSGVASNDPTIGFINVVEDVQLVENDRRNIAAYEQLKLVYAELIKGESSGLSQLQLDQVDSSLQGARQRLVLDRTQYRFDLDQFKAQMGLPPDTPLVPDRSLTRSFKEVYDAIEDWQRDPRRRLEDLPNFAARLPKLNDVVIDGRSVLAVYPEGQSQAGEDQLEDLLLAAERTALEHRLDLMNERARLYDTWRQIAVTANALQGIFNIALTNTFVTPPKTNNPFGFVDDARQFSLVLNAELPLVRMTERNAFRQSLITYQRQRRSLQNTEDSIKTIVRQDIRIMHLNYLTFEIAKRNFILAIRLKDQAFEQIVAPPQGGAAVSTNQAALQTTNLINFQNQLLNFENSLVTSWYQYQVARLQLYRDLGILPYDEWEAFHELFPAEPIRSGPPTASAAAEGSTRTAGANSAASGETARR
ncbi:MAG: hypothetical protein NVSMB9_15710 [Isosphaeraceae bacterium]